MPSETSRQLKVDRLYDAAEAAAEHYATYSLGQVETIVHAVAKAAEKQAEFYAEWSVRETGYGLVEAKTAKNIATSTGLISSYNIADYVEPRIDHEKKILMIPKPAGVVIAPMPCTNPIMTVNFKIIANLIARNAVILCPHPAARDVCVHAADYLGDVAEKAGAPKGCVQILDQPSIEVVNILMQSPRTSLIMATGGPDLVRAAYSSGNPAVGVGPANVPCYVHKSADVEKAGGAIVVGNSFDNSLPCTCESVALADHAISDQLKRSISENGGWFAEGSDNQTLREFLFQDGIPNPAALGKSPLWIGEQAGIAIPGETKSIVFEITKIGHDEPISKEKMFPVLGFYKIEGGVDEGISKALEMLNLIGKGHSAVIHAEDPGVVARYSMAMPVCRLAVNTPGMTGSAGMTTNLCPTGAVGTGFWGGSSTDQNIGPQHLIQYTAVAYDSDPSVKMGNIEEALAR
ncbi:aldehyde dehydrogenase family protein [Halieaceae bacterium IMCC8485]|uniref:Aldehyde dehydrogenase family protein n=1 Tax=Candidatus Seongchinamella marina TaxID=2518990 RepID=A0ABT3SZK2_9GAMM|nr:aldehyde dehydrogenase family protein [Candidatus Seongchinamella marina]MCX2975428.1 aldehyde dehydrogenase family protein [Candidatus Seongchinamella marina]